MLPWSRPPMSSRWQWPHIERASCDAQSCVSLVGLHRCEPMRRHNSGGGGIEGGGGGGGGEDSKPRALHVWHRWLRICITAVLHIAIRTRNRWDVFRTQPTKERREESKKEKEKIKKSDQALYSNTRYTLPQIALLRDTLWHFYSLPMRIVSVSVSLSSFLSCSSSPWPRVPTLCR